MELGEKIRDSARTLLYKGLIYSEFGYKRCRSRQRVFKYRVKDAPYMERVKLRINNIPVILKERLYRLGITIFSYLIIFATGNGKNGGINNG